MKMKSICFIFKWNGISIPYSRMDLSVCLNLYLQDFQYDTNNATERKWENTNFFFFTVAF